MGHHHHHHSTSSSSAGHSSHPVSYYVKTWGLLLVLFFVSVVGPMFGHKWLTLITAFGIAIVKAGIVASRFMHLNVEKKFVTYLLLSMVVIMGMLFFGTAADIMKPSGSRWIRTIGEQSPSPASHSAGH